MEKTITLFALIAAVADSVALAAREKLEVFINPKLFFIPLLPKKAMVVEIISTNTEILIRKFIEEYLSQQKQLQ